MAETSWNLGAGLDGRGVIVTGAASGIGRATAIAMAAAGARVAAVDRDGPGLLDAVAAMPGANHLPITFDLAEISSIEGLVADIAAEFGDLWALAAVAAFLRRQTLEEVTEADWDDQHDVNLKAAFFLNRAAGRAMISGGKGGRIVNFSSLAWLTGPVFGSDAYVASKAGVVSMTRGFARHFGPHGVLVNTIAPGQIDTPMQHNDNRPEVVAAATAQCPLGRMGRPEELAAVAVFLASQHASFVNGATINVSGGLVMY